MTTMAFRMLEDGIVVCVHSAADADPLVWDAYLEAIRTQPVASFRTLVFTDGGRATRSQFARLDDAFGNRSVRTAVVSSSIATRIFGTMVNALSKNMNAAFFPPEEVYEALASLAITSDDAMARVLDCATELAATVAADGHLASFGSRPPAR